MQLSERVLRICTFNLGRVSCPIQVEGADSSTASRGLFIAHALPTLIAHHVRVYTTHSLICRVPWIQQMIPKIHEHFTLQWLCQPVGERDGIDNVQWMSRGTNPPGNGNPRCVVRLVCCGLGRWHREDQVGARCTRKVSCGNVLFSTFFHV